MGTLGDFLVRSDLEDFTFENSPSLTLKQAELMKRINDKQDVFYTFCNGVNESTIITSISVAETLKEVFANENLKSYNTDLASITIKLPSSNTEISGIYYYILKHLAWEGINIVEIVSTANEFSVVVNSDDIDAAFSVLMQLKKQGKSAALIDG
jgi:aspartokinase